MCLFAQCTFLNSDSDFLVSYFARVLNMAMRAKKSKRLLKQLKQLKLTVMAYPEMPTS